MSRKLAALLTIGTLALAAAAPGCTADVHDNTVNANVDLDNANLSMTSSSSTVAASASVSLNVSVASGVVLVAPDQTPPANETDVAAYFEVFIDSESGTPLVTTASTSITVTVPSSTPPGSHNMICRLHHHDGSATKSVTQVSVTVSASASSGGNVDAG
jgi:hypothetical protein